ncbi:MAG: hypothetical protein AAFN50_02820 [Pseudomonadota bacterium]
MLSIPNATDIPLFEFKSEFFGVLLVWDSIGTNEDELVAVGKKLIDQGAVYVCCWGPGCEKLHDAIDHADQENDRPGDAVLMTTWHDDEPLSEALWFFINTAFPHELYESECRGSIAIVIDNQSWADECSDALSKPRQFSQQALAES